MNELLSNIDSFCSEALSVDDREEIDIDNVEEQGNNDFMENIDSTDNLIENKSTQHTAFARSKINYKFDSEDELPLINFAVRPFEWTEAGNRS